MSQFSFETTSHKGTCPQCGHTKKFRFYQDAQGNRLEGFGRCERVNSCGFWLIPDATDLPPVDRPYTPPPQVRTILPDKAKLDHLSKVLIDKSSPFHTFCAKLGIPVEHLNKWGVGTDYKFNKTYTVFIHQDANQRIVNAKWFRYSDAGKRVKNKEGEVDSFSLKQPPADTLTKYALCVYGEHLLDPKGRRRVMVVESEKTAVMASHFYPAFDWVAVGSANGLTNAKIGALLGRRMYWLADADGNQRLINARSGKEYLSEGGRNNSSIRKLVAYEQRFSIIDLYPDSNDGQDIADALSQGWQPDLLTLAENAVLYTPPAEPETTEPETPPEPETSPPAEPGTPSSAETPPAEGEATPENEQSTITNVVVMPPVNELDKPVGNATDKGNKRNQAAREPKEANFFQEDSVLYHTASHSILVKGQKGWNLIARGFYVYLKFKLKDEQENTNWIVEIRPDQGRDSIFLEVTHDDFCSAAKFKKLFTNEKFSLQVSDAELSKLQEHLFTKTKVPDAIKIIRFGFHVESEVFFFANAAVKDGQELVCDEFSIVEANPLFLCMPTVPKVGRHPFSLTPPVISVNDWYKLYAEAHSYQNAFVPACFYMMSLFRDISISYKNFSPILFLKGGAGTGKSSIVRNLTCLYGFRAKDINLKTKNTASALVKLMSQSSNTIVWFDEFYNKFEQEGLLQAAYDNAGYHLSAGVGTSETTEIDIKSALALTSNYVPDNPIFLSRCLFIPIEKTSKTVDQRRAYKQLTDLEENGLGSITVELLKHRAYIKKNYDRGYTLLYQGLTYALPPETDERPKQNMAQTMTSAYLLNEIGAIAMTEHTDPADILNEFISMGIQAIERQLSLQLEHTPLFEFFQILQLLYDEKRIMESIHFRFEGPFIHLRFSQLYTTFIQRYRMVFFRDAPDKDTLLSEIEQFVGNVDRENLLKSIRFRPDEHENKSSGTLPIRNSCTINYVALQARFNIDFRL